MTSLTTKAFCQCKNHRTFVDKKSKTRHSFDYWIDFDFDIFDHSSVLHHHCDNYVADSYSLGDSCPVAVVGSFDRTVAEPAIGRYCFYLNFYKIKQKLKTNSFQLKGRQLTN